jgi:hypothetical protein
MPRNPSKRRCAVPGCRACEVRLRMGAMRESDPPHCSPHSGQAGAPEGNQNRLVHGFYATAVHPEELGDLAIDASGASLQAEIAITRIALRRIFGMLVTGQTPGPDPRPLEVQDYARFVGLAFQGAGAISRLLRANHAVGGQTSDIPHAIESALDELGAQWGIEL